MHQVVMHHLDLSEPGKLPNVDGRHHVGAAVERLPGDDDVHRRRRVVRVPEHVALPFGARRHEGQARDLPAVPPDAAAAPVHHAQPCPPP